MGFFYTMKNKEDIVILNCTKCGTQVERNKRYFKSPQKTVCFPCKELRRLEYSRKNKKPHTCRFMVNKTSLTKKCRICKLEVKSG